MTKSSTLRSENKSPWFYSFFSIRAKVTDVVCNMSVRHFQPFSVSKKGIKTIIFSVIFTNHFFFEENSACSSHDELIERLTLAVIIERQVTVTKNLPLAYKKAIERAVRKKKSPVRVDFLFFMQNSSYRNTDCGTRHHLTSAKPCK